MSCTRKFSGKLPCHWRCFGSLSLALCSLATKFDSSLRWVPGCLCCVLCVVCNSMPHDILTISSRYPHDNLTISSRYSASFQSWNLRESWQSMCIPLSPFHLLLIIPYSALLPGSKRPEHESTRLRIWSIWSLAQGFAADENDWRVPHLKSYWNLVVRLSWFVGGRKWKYVEVCGSEM